MKKVKLNNIEYEVIKDYKDSFNSEELLEKFTDYFEPYDYVLGDYAYSKLRLKGFYDSDNKNATKINDINFLDEYIKNYCAYDCGYFLIKKNK